MARPFALALVLSLALLPSKAQATEPPADIAITSCGQVIPKKTLGYLTGDLDCTGFTGGPSNVDAGQAGAAVYIEKKGRLDLRGFTITGGNQGVWCNALRCKHNVPCSRHGSCEVFNGTLGRAPGAHPRDHHGQLLHVAGGTWGVCAAD